MASDDFTKGLGLGPQPTGDVADETAASVIELSGVIKWFDVSKGFGSGNGLPVLSQHGRASRQGRHPPYPDLHQLAQ